MIKIDTSVPLKHHYDMFDGEVETIQVDFSNDVGREGTTVSTVSWDVGGPLSSASESVASNVATAVFTASGSGYENVVITATYANSDKKVMVIKFRVQDPDAC